MNLRTLKKLSKRALPYLELLGCRLETFITGPETSNGFTNCHIERKHFERARSKHDDLLFWPYKAKAYDGNGFIYMHKPSRLWDGTPIVGWQSGYFEPEWEEETAYEWLKIEVENHFIDWPKFELTDETGYPALTRRLDTPRQIFKAADEIVRKMMMEKQLGVAS